MQALKPESTTFTAHSNRNIIAVHLIPRTLGGQHRQSHHTEEETEIQTAHPSVQAPDPGRGGAGACPKHRKVQPNVLTPSHPSSRARGQVGATQSGHQGLQAPSPSGRGPCGHWPLDWLKGSVQRERGLLLLSLAAKLWPGRPHPLQPWTPGSGCLRAAAIRPLFQGRQYTSCTPKGQGGWWLRAWTWA